MQSRPQNLLLSAKSKTNIFTDHSRFHQLHHHNHLSRHKGSQVVYKIHSNICTFQRTLENKSLSYRPYHPTRFNNNQIISFMFLLTCSHSYFDQGLQAYRLETLLYLQNIKRQLGHCSKPSRVKLATGSKIPEKEVKLLRQKILPLNIQSVLKICPEIIQNFFPQYVAKVEPQPGTSLDSPIFKPTNVILHDNQFNIVQFVFQITSANRDPL